jgi:enamine deaminase RidA (YjgF/YER057c/UK114 family)
MPVLDPHRLFERSRWILGALPDLQEVIVPNRFFLILAAGAMCISVARAESPQLQFLNPDGLFRPSTFTQVVTSRGGTTVYVSGQTARDAQSNIVGVGDLRTQTSKTFDNLRTALDGVGASFAHVVKITTFVVDLQPDDRLMIGEMVKSRFPPGRPPAHTLVGVQALAVPELLIEIEAIAVVD